MKQYSQKRPAAVTFIGTILLIRAGFGLLLLLPIICPRDPYTQNLPVNWNAVWLVVVPIVLYATCGFFMLKGANWARLLYFVMVPVLYITIGALIYSHVSAFSRVKMAALPVSIVVHLVVFAICCGLLLSRRANRFFIGKDKVVKKQQSKSSGNQYDKLNKKSFDY